MSRLSLLLFLLLLCLFSPKNHASFAKELLACKWSKDEYLLLRASLPRSGTGYYFIESVTASGKQELSKFEDKRMALMHNAISGATLRQLSSVYFLNDGQHQFLVHFFKTREDKMPSGVWLLNLPGYRTESLVETSCMDCETVNNYCRDLFKKE